MKFYSVIKDLSVPGFTPLAMALGLQVVLLLSPGCSKSDMQHSASPASFPQLSRDSGDKDAVAQRDNLAFTDRQTGPYEMLGITLYDYAVYYQDERESYELVAPEIREEVKKYEQKMLQRYGHIESIQELAGALERDNLTPKGQSLDFYTDFVDRVKKQDFTSFGQFWFYMKDMENYILNNNQYNEWQKRLLLSYSVLGRYVMKYGYAQTKFFQQTGNGAVAERAECDELDCTLNEIGLNVLLGLISGPKGAVMGFFKGLIGSIFKCDCYDSDCIPPLRYRIGFTNCNLTTQNITFLGQGPDVTTITWQLINGTALELGGGSFGITTTPSLTITQVDPTLPVDVVLTFTCNEKQYANTFKIDINFEVEGGTHWIEGPSPIAAGSEVMYSMNGTCLFNPFNINYFIDVLNDTGYEVGTVTTNSGTSCVIRWNYMPPETHGDEWWGTVQGGFTNTCVNANRLAAKQVIITRGGGGQSN